MPIPAHMPAPQWSWLPLPRGAVAEPLARQWLAGRLELAPEAVPLVRDRQGRPRLVAPMERFDCNWSHSGEGLLVALGEDVQVGIDLEWPRPRPRALALARRFFTSPEAAWLETLPPAARTAAFLRLWCAREAVLKATGNGLSFGLHRLRFADSADGLQLIECDPALGSPGDWQLVEIDPAPGYVGALAWHPAGNAPGR